MIELSERTGMIWTLAAVEEQLVLAHELWRRSPGGGRWPFAGDGPWHLAQGEAGDYAGEGTDGVSSTARPRSPLDTAEVGLRDEVTAWLQLLEEPVDRRMLFLATRQLHLGEGRVPFTALAAWLGWERSVQALRMRYRRALAVIVCALNGWHRRRLLSVAQGHFEEVG